MIIIENGGCMLTISYLYWVNNELYRLNMDENSPSCFMFGVSHVCPLCKSIHLIKSNKTTTRKQRYSCKKNNSRFIINYP